ncbi:AraC family transcriptional regulator [Aquimarina sp. Aq78]|uniref:helix-turn-helix domain-containing protein n=1 Tax=Aquimarina sp. Aq78 TaxID=1191889 RepID=UPI00131D50F5|nr:helix-turn-helix domain-containing protein [Aquimarina sp. Aq78]
MEVYNDINSYYPSDLKSPKTLYEDFKIMKLESIINSMNKKELEKYKKPHRRSFFEFSIGKKESNSPQVIIGANEFVGVDNNLMFTTMGQVFSIDFNDKLKAEENEGYIVAFKPSFMIKERGDFEIMNRFRFFNSYTFPHYILTSTQMDITNNLTQNMYKEYVNDEKYAREIIMGYLDVLLHSFNRILSLSPDTIAFTSYDRIAAHFEQEIFKDGIELVSIADYALRLNISPNYLSESVKKSTGKNARQVLLDHKLIIAKSLLQQRKRSIAEIAFEMGFSEPTNFTKFFKQMAGLTPNKFRFNLNSTS